MTSSVNFLRELHSRLTCDRENILAENRVTSQLDLTEQDPIIAGNAEWSIQPGMRFKRLHVVTSGRLSP